jgi:hypothetical protein
MIIDAIGPSKENRSITVPATAPTVTSAEIGYVLPEPPERQAMLVEELHDEVLHSPGPMATLEVCSPTPKLSPLTVTDPPPLNGAFSSIPDATALSKLNTNSPVPAIAPTVS